MKTNLVSCIIATKNEENNLGRLLISLKKQTYLALEIIVVDNASFDKTKEIARSFEAQVFDFGPERSPQRNFGAKKAKGEYVLFLDADMELEVDVIKQCVSKAEKDLDLAAVIIPEESVGEGFWARAKALERQTYLGDSAIEAPRFFNKKIFLEIGGYDETLVAAEDWDLTSRIKKSSFKVARIKAQIMHHEGNLKLTDSLRKKFYYGKKLRQFLAKKNFSGEQVIPLRMSYLRHWRLFLAHPIETIGFVIMKSLELGALFLGLIFSFF